MSQRTHPLIVIEGIDGAGKGSQAQGLVDWFLKENLKTVYRHFPEYQNVTGHAIARHLHKEWAATNVAGVVDPVDELVFQCLMTLNRYEEAGSLAKELRQGVVVCDRYTPSGLVYGAINRVPALFLTDVQALLPPPDVCILIDTPVRESLQRRTRKLDRYEEQEDMQERARVEYLRLFRQNGWHVVDGTGSYEEVQTRIRACIPSSLFL